MFKMKIQSLNLKDLGLFFVFSLITIYFSLLTVSHAAHPLITDDTGTQGKGKFQIEINSEFTYDKEKEKVFDEDAGDYVTETKKTTGGELATILSYGITDNLDIVIGLPYQWSKVKKNGTVEWDVDGISDMSLEAKWRFFEKDGLSFALKPGITLPTGDENKGLGNGRASYGLVFITTKEIEPWAFHFNLGYTHNEYKLQADKDANRKGIWHVSLASEVEVIKDLKAVANIGMERNPDKASNTHPAFILGGLIYSVTENFDIDIGVKGGLNKPETDLTFLAGIAFRF
ncbi:transporter [Dissulfurispira sp.]|uniref:transporter n=1 Tax=Dissulfurispira sp. TaxID=2817609 RepID=UPI002FD9E860